MSIDTTKEQILSFAHAGRHGRPRGTRPISPSTIWRWHKKGISGVRLETICIGGTRYTSVEALQRFFDAVTLARSRQDDLPAANADSGSRSASTTKRLLEAGLS